MFIGNNLNFEFINHSSFLIESELSILLVDPWVEGSVFFGGWRLIDQSTSNISLIKRSLYSQAAGKTIYIYYTHEHPDHFSISFLLGIHSATEITVLCNKSTENTIGKFCISQNINTIVIPEVEKYKIDDEIQIAFMPWRQYGDTVLSIYTRYYQLLNINDCSIVLKEDLSLMDAILDRSKDLYILQQFGYAGWQGLDQQEALLINEAAQEKIRNIRYSAEYFRPKLIILFASHSYFCRSCNFYFNKYQNSPQKIRSILDQQNINTEIVFLKPGFKHHASSSQSLRSSLLVNTTHAESHWSKLIEKIRIDMTPEQVYTPDDICISFLKFRDKIYTTFGMDKVNNFARTHRSELKVLCEDISSYIILTYENGVSTSNYNGQAVDIKLSSSALMFSLENEFGHFTVDIGAMYEPVNGQKSQAKWFTFFLPQTMIRFPPAIS